MILLPGVFNTRNEIQNTMKNLKRHSLYVVPALMALVFLLVFLVRFQDEIETREHDRALIAAIKADNLEAAQDLLADYANPNARDLPPDTRTLWQKFLNVLRPAPPEDRAAPSAISLVIRPYVYDEFEAPLREKRFALLKLLHDAGAKPEGDAPQFQSRRAALTEETRHLPEAPIIIGDHTPDEIRADLQAGLSAIGVSAQVYGSLGHCYEKSGEREAAVRAYRVALLWLPDDAALQARLTELTAAPIAKQAIARALPARTKVLRVLLFQTVGGKRQWAVLTGKKQGVDALVFGVRAALYQEDGGVFTRLCQSPVLTNSKDNSDSFDEADLSVVRATGRPLPEIVTRIARGDPHLDIWDLNRGRFENILSLGGDSNVNLEDIRSDRHYEARNEYAAGGSTETRNPHGDWSGMLHRWDVYAFNGKRYVFADPDFPEQFSEYLKDGEERLAEAPDDPDLLRHMAYLYHITGKPQKSEAYFRRAEKLCRADLRDALAKHIPPADTAYTRKQLRHILARDSQTDY